MNHAERRIKVKEIAEAQKVVMRVQDSQKRTSANYRRAQKAMDVLAEARWAQDETGSDELEAKMAKAQKVLDLIEAKGAKAVKFYNG